MKINVRSMAARVASLAILALALLDAASSAQTPAKSLKDEVVGHWQLVSISINGNTPYGANPQGSMFLDAGGHYAVIVITGGRARSISYYGTYTVNDADDSMTMHIDGSNRADFAGHDVKRVISVSGDEMIVANATASGAAGPTKLTWKRAN